MSGAVSLLPLYAFMVWIVTSLRLLYSFSIDCCSDKDCRSGIVYLFMVYVTKSQYFRLSLNGMMMN
jgi:hypothetical protein